METPPAQVIGYVPAVLALVAVVVQVGWVLSTATVSDPIRPLVLKVKVGTLLPAVMDWALAVIVRGTGLTVSVPGTKVKV